MRKYTEKAFQYGLVPEVLQFREFMTSPEETSIRKQENILTLRATYWKERIYFWTFHIRID